MPEIADDSAAKKSDETHKDSKKKKPWWRSGYTAIIAALAAGIIAAITSLTQEGITSIGHRLVSSNVLSIHLSAIALSAGCYGEKGWVFPKRLSQLPAPDTTNPRLDFDSWARRNNGVPASGDYVELVLQPVRQQQTVVIDSISVQIVGESPPFHGAYIQGFGQCGGIQPDFFQANLDSRPISITPVKGQNSTLKVVEPVPLPHVLTEGSPEVWNVSAIARHSIYRWVINVHWTSGNDSGTLLVDDNGQPFETAPTVGLTEALPNQEEPPGWVIGRY